MKSFSDDLRWDDLKNKAIQILNTEIIDSGRSTPDETVKLIQELDVYRIEQELENRKLVVAKEQAEKEKNEFMEIFDLAPVGLIELNSFGEIQKVNSQAASILNLDRESLINTPFDILLTNQSHPVFNEFIKSVEENRNIKNIEISLLINHKKLKEIEISCVATESSKTILISLRDITRYKKAEQHLVRSKERAETADRHKSSFLSTMSHEIRAPLNSIIGFSGILLQEIPGTLNAEQKKQLGMIQTSGRHLLSLINDLLDLSKIEAGQLNINPEHFNLLEVIEDVMQLEWPLANGKNIALELKIVPGIEEVKSDKQRIHQIILNILNNAIKFTEKGSVTISCFQENNSVKIEISDTGIGIKKVDLQKIFNPFIQIENDLTKTQIGSGLGLPVTRKFLELLKGTIEVSSVLGKGTTFTISLPVDPDLDNHS